MEFIKPNTRFQFMARKDLFFRGSLILIAISIVLLAVRGLNYSIDFKGGMELQYQFSSNLSVGDIRSVLKKHGAGTAVVQKIQGENEFMLAFEQAEDLKKETITNWLSTAFPMDGVRLRKVDSVGPKVGSDLKKAAVLSIIYALFLILGYIWFRFDLVFSPAAVAALVHDVVITLGILSLFQVSFSLSVIAAILTIVGYSLNDTIVVFDRIRDNLAEFGKLTLEKTIDRSINECLSRTILTSLTTFFVVLMLIFFGGPALHPFALTLSIGVVVGTYSSIFIASPMAIYAERWLTRRKEVKRRQ